MRSVQGVWRDDVAGFYDGTGGSVVALVMGEQAHIGGLDATLELAWLSGIGEGDVGIDLCCFRGGGMRALVRFCGVASMTGVDISAVMIEAGQDCCEEEGLGDRIRFVLADACESGLPDGRADFVWSEDAWIYVPDKASVVAEAVRLVRPGGVIAFTEWVEGPAGLTDDEAELLLPSMNFPSIETLDGYVALLQQHGCEVTSADDTGRFGGFMGRYVDMLRDQQRYDALRLLDFDEEALAAITEAFAWLAELGDSGKLAQARFVARVP